MTLATSCSQNHVTVEISNPTNENRHEELVSINIKEITNKLNLTENETFIIKSQEGSELTYQITYDNKIILPVKLRAQESTRLTFVKGSPSRADTLTYGNIYPKRMDDIAWENDLVAFRAYGPTVQKKGEKAFGYDIFAKRGTTARILPQMYKLVTDNTLKEKVKELKISNPEESKKLQDYRSYHVDKGNGMDCYAVGPTLGAGTTALVNKDTIVYPWCFKEYEILDNGPLRFTVKLKFNPTKIDGMDVTETRIVSLDAGSHLNKTIVCYEGLDKETQMVSGIVLHDKSNCFFSDSKAKHMSYVDPTTKTGQGELYIGQVFLESPLAMKAIYFSPEESKKRNNACGQLLAYKSYKPNSEYVYWWGYGWNKSNIKDIHEWNKYLTQFSEQLKFPLIIKII